MFDQLTHTRSVARARSVEDFVYFREAVLGPHYYRADAQQLWQSVVDGVAVEFCPTETFRWLFPELLPQGAQRVA